MLLNNAMWSLEPFNMQLWDSVSVNIWNYFVLKMFEIIIFMAYENILTMK